MLIGLCHGVFDILHFGHIRHFLAAKAMCDELVVSVTSDRYVNKGPGRPVFSLEQRIEVLSSIAVISRVIASDCPNGLQSLQQIRPGIYFKDVEYRGSVHPGFVAEQEYCAAHRIRLVFTEELRSSSTAALQKLREALND